MSRTTTLSESTPAAKTVTLQNGNIFSFQSNNSIDLDLIPVIDASRIWSSEFEDRRAVAEEIRDASRKIGFFYLINHVGLFVFDTTMISSNISSLGRRGKVCYASNGASKEILCIARGQENGGIHGTGTKRICGLPSNEVLQP